MGELRFMILNYSKDTRRFTVTFEGPTDRLYRLKSCLTNGDATTPDKPEGDALEAGKPHGFEVPGGMIFGFVADDEVVFTIETPDEKILVLTAAGKNPWPTPPPDAPSKYSSRDFAVRFENFNRGNAAGTADPHVIRYRVEIPGTARSIGAGGGETSA